MCPDVYKQLKEAIQLLSERRLHKGGKKSYDLLVTGYFNDMYCELKEAYRVLKPGRSMVFVLGDSAPYGVHIPTDEFIGKIAIAETNLVTGRQGRVDFKGTTWNAISDIDIKAGDQVKILNKDSITLIVTKIN